MRRIEIATLLALGVMMGCMTAAPPPHAQSPSEPAAGATGTSHGSPLASSVLVLDRADLALGTTVEFHRLPGPDELQDAAEQFAVRHVVVTLPAWPQNNDELPRFGSLPPEADAIVILPGYPPDRAAIAAWNYVAGPIRLVMLVDGPPESSVLLDDLNTMRHLERVIARMEHPSRAGFERLQRPLSFVHVVD
jgi:hypothetical protein